MVTVHTLAKKFKGHLYNTNESIDWVVKLKHWRQCLCIRLGFTMDNYVTN